MRGQKDSSLIRKETVWMESSTMIKMVSQYSRKTLRDNGSTRTVIDLRETLVSTRTDNHD
jgi:predicted HAD superfamily phosphohydrolase YqeG